MASRQKAEKSRNWTNEEINLFVEILDDEEYGFAVCLGRKALKISTNEEVFQEIKNVFGERLSEEHFRNKNSKNFGKRDYIDLDISIKKLQVKYNGLKKMEGTQRSSNKTLWSMS